MNNSVKRFARTTKDAWPQSPEYGAAIEKPYRKKDYGSKVVVLGILLYVMLIICWNV